MLHTVSMSWLSCDPGTDNILVCNPFGGLGLTGGIVDVGGLYDCLAGIHEGKAEASILDTYSEIRRQKYKEIVDPISQDNIRRLYDQDADTALENDGFLKQMKANEGNVAAQQELLRSSRALKYDFTQHYKTAHRSPEEATKGGSIHVEQMAVMAEG